MKKIVLTGDLLRLEADQKNTNQIANITWLYHLLKYQLSCATKLEVKLIHTASQDPFDASLFYLLNHLSPSQENWIKIYNATPSQDALKLINKYFQNSFVIGFELPEIFIKAFDTLSIPYIDIIIHPIRYLDDLLLAFRSSEPSVYTKLKEFQIDEEYYYIHANIHTATMAKMKKPLLKPHSMIFAGQLELDKSLINGDTLMRVEHYQTKLKELSKEYSHIYVKPHPYEKNKERFYTIFDTFSNVSYTDQNIYSLLAQEEIQALYSMSSSTVFEAQYWGKKAEYLYKSPFYIDHARQEANQKEYISIQDHFLTTCFWSEILSTIFPTTKMQAFPLFKKTSRLRESLQSYWGYDFQSNNKR